MFTGFMTYHTNPSIHRLRDDLDKPEMIRIVSWIDPRVATFAATECSTPGPPRRGPDVFPSEILSRRADSNSRPAVYECAKWRVSLAQGVSLFEIASPEVS